MQLFTVFIFSLFLTIAIVPLCKRLAFKMNIVDVPDERKAHVAPMPKMGGISMAIGTFIPVLIWLPRNDFSNAVFIACGIIVTFGLIDDIKILTPLQKLLPQILAALIVIFFGGVKISYMGSLMPQNVALPTYMAVPLTLFVILGVTNAINLADGLDGLAGGISMLSFALIVYLANDCENMHIAVIAVAMVGAIAGFLRYNTHPAVLFMGDAGSQLLGFLVIVLAIKLTQANTPYSKLLSLPIIGFPILDTLTVMISRMAKGRSPFSPDKTHFHHKLMQLGFYHAESVLVIYILQSIFIVMALKYQFYSSWVHVVGFAILSGIILLYFYLTTIYGWKFREPGTPDYITKRWHSSMKKRRLYNRISFGMFKYFLPLLMAFQTVIPESIPQYVAITAFAFMLLLAGGYILKLIRFRDRFIRFSAYTVIPALIYFGEYNQASWYTPFWTILNNSFYILLTFFGIATLNLTRRKNGFKITATDMLVIILIMVFPNLPFVHFNDFHLSMVMTRSMILFFSFDVLMGELRDNTEFIAWPLVVSLAIISLRGFL